MLVPWAAGFVTYQLINPGYLSWWVSAWAWVRGLIGFTPASWMSASICSFVVAAALTMLGFPLSRLGAYLEKSNYVPVAGLRGRLAWRSSSPPADSAARTGTNGSASQPSRPKQP
jgi:hypothetical protein